MQCTRSLMPPPCSFMCCSPYKKSRAAPRAFLYIDIYVCDGFCLCPAAAKGRRSEKQIMRNHIQKGVQHLKIEANGTWREKKEAAQREWLLYGEKSADGGGFSFRAHCKIELLQSFFPCKKSHPPYCNLLAILLLVIFE
jgi:hypothetical protein